MNSPQDTKTRILEVAEELFAEHGLDRVSIRDITEAARVNLAAVNYHFGGKDELISAVFERRLAPLNHARLEALDQVERSAGVKGPAVEEIVEAMIRPTIDCCLGTSGTAFSKIFGRCLAETRPEVETLLRKQFDPLVMRLDAAFRKALPNLTRSEIFWRMKFTFGALHHWLLTRDKFIPPWAEKADLEDQTKKLIKFTTAGFKA